MQMLAQEYPVTQICEVWGSTRSSYYQRKVATDEAALQEAMKRLAGQWPTYGYRRITQQLRREGWTVNHKRVERLIARSRATNPSESQTAHYDRQFASLSALSQPRGTPGNPAS